MVDNQISDILKSKGITISKRTINKCRNKLKFQRRNLWNLKYKPLIII
ncbi:hypothetical protein [Borrelia turicatae]|nr:hypothetical protein [Borrelia turicatae]